MDQIASFKLTCQAPKDYKVLAAGDLISTDNAGETESYVWESKYPVFKLPVIIFNPAKYKNTENKIASFYYSGMNTMEAQRFCFKYLQ